MTETVATRRIVISAIALLVVGAQVAGATTINVTTTSAGTGGPGCTLRDAVTAANSDAPVGDCPTGAGDDVIVLIAGTYELTAVDNTIDEANGLPVIETPIRIAGQGATILRSQVPRTPRFRILLVTATGNLTLEDLTLRGGHSPDGGSAFGNGYRGASGGAIKNAGGTLNLIRVTIEASSSGSGGNEDYPGSGGLGGGLYQLGGTLTVVDSTIANNSTGHGGSGLGAGNGGDGGGVYLAYVDADVRGSTMSGNSTGSGGYRYSTNYTRGDGGDGGGIFARGGRVAIVNSTLSDNVTGAGGQGGSEPNGPRGDGGGIAWFESEDEPGTLTLRNSTVSHNRTGTGEAGGTTAGAGGGVYSVRSRIASLIFADTILADNVASTESPDCVGPMRSEGYNLIGALGQCTVSGAVTGNVIGQSPQLGALQDNGGRSATRALLAGSPAIDAGNPDGCTDSAALPLVTDQRGELRDDARCDIGAFEARGADLTPTVTPSPTEIFPACCLNGTCPSLCGPTRIPTETPAPPTCVGDCDGDVVVSVDELVLGVAIVLRQMPSDTCQAFGQERVDVSALVRAVNALLRGC